MTAPKILTSKLIAIICISSLVLAFSACKKDDAQRKIRIIDIPAEYNGHLARLNLTYESNGTVGFLTITNGEVTTKLIDTRGPYMSDPPRPLTENTELYLKFEILDGMINDGTIFCGSVILSVKSNGKINITQETTTISFKTLEKEEPNDR